MATYQITTPNGETYKVTGPPGASREDLIQQLEAQKSAPSNQYGDDYQYKSEDTNFLVDVKDTAVGGLSGIYKAASGLVSLGSLIPGEVPFTDFKLSKPFDYVSEALYTAGENVDEALLSDRQKEINEELSIRLQQAAGELGPDASTMDYIDAMVAQGGEAGQFIIDHPGQALNLVVQSLPYIFGGGVAGTAIKGGAKGLSLASSKLGLTKTKSVTDKVANMSELARIAAGEGAISAGANLQQVVRETDGEIDMLNRYKTVPGGVFTGLVGYRGAKFAQSAGLRDIDLLVAGKKTSVSPSATSGSTARNVGLGTAIEGGEEFLQSAGEKISENWALEKNLLSDVGGETILGTVAGTTQGGIVNTIRETARKDNKTLDVPEELEQELAEAAEAKKTEDAQRAVEIQNFIEGATAVNTPEELEAFAAEQGVSVSEIQANPEFQRVQEEKASALEEENKKTARKKHASTFLTQKEWTAQEQEDVYQQRRAEISNPETELGQAFDAWVENDNIEFEGKLEREPSEVSELGNPSELAVKGFIKDNPSLFDNELSSTYKVALEEHARVQEENISDPKLSLQYGIYFKSQLELKNAAIERGDLQEAANIEANIDSMRNEDPLIKARWDEFKRNAAVQAVEDAKEAKAASKKKPAKAAAGTTESTDDIAGDASEAAANAAKKLAEQKAKDAQEAEQKEIEGFSNLEQEDFVSGITPQGPVQPTAADQAAQQDETLVVEPEQEITAEQKLLDLPQSKSRIGTKKRTRFDDAQIEFGRKGQNVEQTHPDLFKAINASVTDKVYNKRLEEAREKQKILDESVELTETGARTTGDFKMEPGTWQRGVLDVLEKASARGNLSDYVSFKPYITHIVAKGKEGRKAETKESIAKKYGLKVEDIFESPITEAQLKEEMKGKTFKTGKEKKDYLKNLGFVEKRTKVKGTGTSVNNPPKYTVQYNSKKQPKKLIPGRAVRIPVNKVTLANFPLEERYKAAEWASSKIAEEVGYIDKSTGKPYTKAKGKKNVDDAFRSYRKKHIAVGKAENNPRELMDSFMERTAFADLYSGREDSQQQLEDYQEDSAYVSSLASEEEIDKGGARDRVEYVDEKGKVKVEDLGATNPDNPGFQTLKTPQNFKVGTVDDFQTRQELKVLKAEAKTLGKEATLAEKQVSDNPTRANKAEATRKRNLANDVVERIAEIERFKEEDSAGKTTKQRSFNEQSSLAVGEATQETIAQQSAKDKELYEKSKKVLSVDKGLERIASLWDTNRTTSFEGKVSFTPSFDNLTEEHQIEWGAKVILAINDEAIPDIKNQQRLMEARINEDYKESKTESEKVVDGQSRTSTAKGKPKSASEPNRKRNTQKISSRSAAEKYATEKLAPIYGPRWRGRKDNAILKVHLKNQDFVAYQKIVDKRVEQSKVMGPIQIKAIIDNKVQVIDMFQPDLFDKSKEANKRSRERLEVIYRKLLGQKHYNKIKDRIFYYDTSNDLLAAGWRGNNIDQAAAFVVPEGFLDNDEPLMVFVMDKIKEGEELQVFMHEVGGHVGIEGILGAEGVKVLSKRIQKLYEEDMAKYGNEDFYTDTMEQALERSPVLNADSEAHFMARHAMRGALSPGYRDKSGTVPQDTLESESIAFFVQAAIALGADPTDQTTAGRLLKKFIDAMKKFLNIALGDDDFNMTAADVATMAWGAARVKLKGGSEFTRTMDRLNTIQRVIRGKLKMSIKNWDTSIEAAVRRNYPKNSKGKYVPFDGSFVKNWSTYQKEQYLEEKGYRVQAQAQVESIIKQAEEHEKNMFDTDNIKKKRDFSFMRPPLNEEEKARSKKEHSRIRELIASQISEEAAYQYDTMANIASNGIDSTKFLHEFIYEHRKDLPAGVTFMDLIDKAETMRNNIKQEVDDIAVQARDLSPDRQVIVDRIIAFGTQEQVWPADPGLKEKSVAAGNVVINKKFEALFKRNLDEKEQKLVMDVYRHGEKMMSLRRYILKMIGLPSDSDFLGVTSLDGPYAALRRTGTHEVILKSKTYVEAEKLFEESSASTSTINKKTLKSKLDDLQTQPKHYSYSYFLTKGEAKKYYDKQIATGKWDTSDEGSRYTPKARAVGQGREPDKKVFDKVLASLETSALDPSSKTYVEGLLKKMYMESMEETNARQGEGKRKGKGVPGFEPTMLNSFVENGKSEANLLANMLYGKEINVALSNVRKEAKAANDPNVMEVHNMIVTHYNLMLNARDTSIMNSIASFTTAMVLTTSLGYHLQNATQPWAVSYPLLAADFNDWRAVQPAMSRGYRIASSLISYDGKVPIIQWSKPATWQTEVNIQKVPAWVNDPKITKAEQTKRLKMWEETIKPLLLAMQDAKLLDLGIEQDLSSSVDLKSSGFKTLDNLLKNGGKVSHRLYQVPRMVEAYNRIATAIAAVELAQNHKNSSKVLKTYQTDPTAYAIRLVRRTQGDFTANDAPAAIKWLTNSVPAGKLIVQFKKFGMMMGWAHVESWKQLRKGLTKEERAMGRRAAAYLIAHTVILSGVRGLPFISYFAMLTFLLGTGEDDDFDPNDTEGVIERKLMEMFPDNIGLAKAIARGPFNLLGVDTHTKLSQANIFSIMPFTDFELSTEGFKNIGIGIFGATGANALNIGRGFEFMAEGNYYRGIESMMPKGVKSAMESWRLGTEGYTARNGNVAAPPDTFAKFQLLLNGLGIPASDIVDLKWTSSEQFQITEFFTKKQQQLKRDYKKAFDKKDNKKMQSLIQDWVKLQDAKDRIRPFFNDAPSAIRRTPIKTLTFSPSRSRKSEKKLQQRFGTDKARNYNIFTGTN